MKQTSTQLKAPLQPNAVLQAQTLINFVDSFKDAFQSIQIVGNQIRFISLDGDVVAYFNIPDIPAQVVEAKLIDTHLEFRDVLGNTLYQVELGDLLVGVDDHIQDILDRLNGVEIEMQEVRDDLSGLEGRVAEDNQRVDDLEDKLDLLEEGFADIIASNINPIMNAQQGSGNATLQKRLIFTKLDGTTVTIDLSNVLAQASVTRFGTFGSAGNHAFRPSVSFIGNNIFNSAPYSQTSFVAFGLIRCFYGRFECAPYGTTNASIVRLDKNSTLNFDVRKTNYDNTEYVFTADYPDEKADLENYSGTVTITGTDGHLERLGCVISFSNIVGVAFIVKIHNTTGYDIGIMPGDVIKVYVWYMARGERR